MTPNHFFEAVTEKKIVLIVTEKKSFESKPGGDELLKTFRAVSVSMSDSVQKVRKVPKLDRNSGGVFFRDLFFLLQRVELLQLVAGWQQVHFNTNPMTFLLELERLKLFESRAFFLFSHSLH